MPGHLARQQLARPDRREEQLDDARRLLLDDARHDPEAVADELAVEQDHRHEREPLLLVVFRAADRLHRQGGRVGRDGLQETDRLIGRRIAGQQRLAAADDRGVRVAVGDELSRRRLAADTLHGDLHVGAQLPALRGLGELDGRARRRGDGHLLGPVGAEELRQHDDRGEDRERHKRRDEQGPLAQPRADLAPGDDGDGVATGHSEITARKSSTSERSAGAKRTTRPDRRAASSRSCSSAPSASANVWASSVASTPSRPSAQPGLAPSTSAAMRRPP